MSENTPAPIPPTDLTVPPTPAKRKRRWKRWLLAAVVAVPVLGVVGVLLLPTILSLGSVRSIALSYASPLVAPNGSLKIDSWSFGWFGGQKINGITLFDDQTAAIAHLNVETGASLLALARGNYDLKQTNVTGDFDVRIDPATGRVNLLHVLGQDKPLAASQPAEAKSDKKPTTPKGEPTARAKAVRSDPIKIPNVTGKVHVAMSGTVSSTDPSNKSIPFTKVQAADVDVDLNDVDKGIPLNGTIRATVDGTPSSIVVSGTVDAIENHVLIIDPNLFNTGSADEQIAELNKVSANLTVTIEQIDLAIVKAALAATGKTDVDVAGLLKGKIAVTLVPGATATVASEALGIDGLKIVAPALKGDTLALNRVEFPLDVAIDSKTAQVTIASAGIKTDVATVDLSGSVPEAALLNLKDKKSPGAAGQLVVKTTVPSLAAIAKLLPHAIALQDGVAVTGGKVADTLTLDVLADGAKVANALTLDAQGTSGGQPIELKPTNVTASANVALRDGLTPAVSDVREIAIDVAAPFATIKGGGVPAKLNVDGNVDLSKLYADVTQFKKLDAVDKLSGQATFTLATDGDPTNLASPLDAKLSFSTTDLTVANKTQTYLEHEAIKGDVDVLYKQAPQAQLITFNKLSVSSSDSLIGLWTAGDTAWVSLPGKDKDGNAIGAYSGKGEFHFRTTKLDRLVAMAGKPADASTQVTRGVVDSVVTLASDATGATYFIATKTNVTKLDVGKLLSNESIAINSNLTLPADAKSARSTFDFTSAFATAKGDADVMLKDASGNVPSSFAIVRSANVSGDVPSLAKLYGLATAISPPKPIVDATTNKPLPPMAVEGGSLAFTGKVTRDDAKQLTSVALNVPGIKDLKVVRGDATFAPAEPITFAMNADLTTNNNPANADPKKASALDNLDRAVATLDLNAPGLATMKTTTPIDVSGFKQSTPSAKGVIHTTASLAPVFNLLTVVSGSPPKQLSGDVVSDETLATHDNAIQLTGGGRLTKLTPTAPDAQPLPAPLQTIALENDVSLDLGDAKAMAVTIAKIDVAAPDARDALALNVTGKLRELGTNNAIDHLVAKVSYDAPQLWPLLQPLADPTGKSIGKIDDLAGKYEKTFTVSGSYPTAKLDADGNSTPIAFNDSIKSLAVSGDVQIDKATLTDKGVNLANVSLPISLKDGVARVAFADGKPPKPMTFNNGTADFGGLSVDLAGVEPILGDVKDKQIVKGATLNPVISNALGKYFNPIFPNATKATAVIELVLSTTDLHLGKSLTTKDSGKAVAVLSLTDMVIANPLSENLLGGVVNQVSKLTGQSGVDTKDISDLTGEMKDATFTLDRGVVTQDATFLVGNKGAVDEKGKPKRYPFKFAGDVQLNSLAMNLTAGFPVALLKDKLRGDAADILAYAPDNLNLGLTGTTSSPKLDSSALSKTFTEAFAKFGTQKLIGGKSGAASGDKEKIGDLVGGLLGGKKGKSKDAGSDESTQSKDDKSSADDGKKKSDADKIGDLVGGLLGGDKKPDAVDPGDASKPSADDPADAPAKKKKKKKDDGN